VVVTGEPVAVLPLSTQEGTGLCTASKVSTNPDVDFPSDPLFYQSQFNAFMESSSSTRMSSVLRTLFDLSNNNPESVGFRSYGDFTNAVAGCPEGGCHFAYSNPDTVFGTRLRGYLNIPTEWVDKPLHFGFYADDGVTLTLYDRRQVSYRVIDRPPKRGFSDWHTTNSVTFKKPGLYPIEILYASLGGDSALELSLFVGTYNDIEHEAELIPVITLKADGFTLLPSTLFYQTESGRPSFEGDLSRCDQCNRRDADRSGNSTCGSSYYCNSAALCAPCDSSLFCGPSCSPCGISTPVCINRNSTYVCAQCSDDSQCPNGRCDPVTNECRGCNEDTDCPETGRCDPQTNVCTGCNDDGDCKSQDKVCDVPSSTCVECNTDEECPSGKYCDSTQHLCQECTSDSHCPRGESCVANACQPCSSTDSCAGNSCNCCPNGLQCAPLTPGGKPACVECTRDANCSDGLRCDSANGRCVEQVSECNTSDRCGPQCSQCPEDRPFCLDGQVCVECRSDTECSEGRFCLSGQCTLCTTDERCGSRCESCADDTPFCKTDGTVAGSTCVGCVEDADCGPGGTCDRNTNTCGTTTCSVTCGEGSVCLGSECVQCFADAHCPCGGTCDTATNTCTTLCNDSGDCQGVEFCSPATQTCERGRRMSNAEPAGGAFCCGAAPEPPRGNKTPAALALLGLAALFLFRLRRAR
jgi:outer membrane exchange protein TraA